jgi:hypothetical protein
MKNYGAVGTDRHANARDRKRENSRKMIVTNRGIFTIQDMIARRAREAKETRRVGRGRAEPEVLVDNSTHSA